MSEGIGLDRGREDLPATIEHERSGRRMSGAGRRAAITLAFTMACAACAAIAGIDEPRARVPASADGDGGALDGGAEAPGDDAALADGSIDEDPPGCPASALACIDFEDGEVTPPEWTSRTPGGSTLGITGEAYRGRSALRSSMAAVPSGGAMAVIESASGLVADLSDAYVRAYVWVGAQPVGVSLGLLSLTGPDVGSLQIVAAASMVSIWPGVDAGGLIVSSTPFPFERWACLELHARVGAPGLVEVWVDDVAVEDLHLSRTVARFDEVLVGAHYSGVPQPVSSFDVLNDDVVVASSRIGCR